MIFVYGAVKYAAYSLWCWAGLRAFRPDLPAPAPRALALGALRLAMGLGFGIVIWLLGTLAARPLRSEAAVYLAVYVPVRWIEWAIIDALFGAQPSGVGPFLLGRDGLSRGWRLRGILLSCLADLPMIVSLGGHLPLGRFMC